MAKRGLTPEEQELFYKRRGYYYGDYKPMTRADSIAKKLLPGVTQESAALDSLLARGEITPVQKFRKLAGVEEGKKPLLTPEEQREEALIKAKLLPGAKRPESPYGKPPWWMNPDALKTDWGKAYARKQIEGTGKSVPDQIEEYRDLIEASEEPIWGKDGTDENLVLRKFGTDRIDALIKGLIPKRSLIDKKWGGLKYQKPDIEKDSVIRLLQPKAKTKPKLDY